MWYKSVNFGAQVYSWGFGGSVTGGVGALGHGSKDTVLEPKLIEVRWATDLSSKVILPPRN